MRTINPEIEIFETLTSAKRYFNKQNAPCMLLESKFGKANAWFVDKSKQAIVEWPKHYILLNEK